MPIYEYTCTACRAEFEQLVRSKTDEKSVGCPKCGGRRVERRPSVIAAPRVDSKPARPPGGCGRCGDPNGSCPFS